MGVGTLVRGKSTWDFAPTEDLESCMPKEDLLKMVKEVSGTLPKFSMRAKFSGGAVAKLEGLVNANMPIMNFNLSYHGIKEIDFEVSGETVQMLNLIKFLRYYKNLDPLCREILEDRDGVYSIINYALKLGTMKFRFKDEHGGAIEIKVDNIQNIADISAKIKWNVSKKTSLVINQPRFIGYKLLRFYTESLFGRKKLVVQETKGRKPQTRYKWMTIMKRDWRHINGLPIEKVTKFIEKKDISSRKDGKGNVTIDFGKIENDEDFDQTFGQLYTL